MLDKESVGFREKDFFFMRGLNMLYVENLNEGHEKVEAHESCKRERHRAQEKWREGMRTIKRLMFEFPLGKYL